MKDCLFCKIVAGEIPAAKIHETKNTLAFLDISPINPGHTLIIPKTHYEDIFQMPDDTLAETAIETKFVGNALKKATDARGISVITRNSRAAGQEIDHSHTHVIPRYVGDGHKSWTGKKYRNGEIEKMTDKIKKEIQTAL